MRKINANTTPKKTQGICWDQEQMYFNSVKLENTNRDRPIVLKRMSPVPFVAPLSSVSPVFLVSLVSTLSPVSPVSLVGPVSPLSPASLVSLVSPVGPVSLVSRLSPVAPVSPVSSVGPVSLVAPVAPEVPTAHVSRTSLLCLCCRRGESYSGFQVTDMIGGVFWGLKFSILGFLENLTVTFFGIQNNLKIRASARVSWPQTTILF